MAVDLNRYQMVSARELSFHAPNGEYENIAVKTWRDERKKNAVCVMAFSISGMALMYILGRVSERPLWMMLVFILIFGILFLWMFITYRSIMSAQALVACVRVVDFGYRSKIGSPYSAGRKYYYATVRQDEDKLLADVIISEAQYRLCSEERTMYVIKADGQCYGINSLNAI